MKNCPPLAIMQTRKLFVDRKKAKSICQERGKNECKNEFFFAPSSCHANIGNEREKCFTKFGNMEKHEDDKNIDNQRLWKRDLYLIE